MEMMKVKGSPEEIAKFLKLSEEQGTEKIVAPQFVPQTPISNISLEPVLPHTRNPNKNKQWKKEEVDLIHTLVSRGLKWPQISKALGRTVNACKWRFYQTKNHPGQVQIKMKKRKMRAPRIVSPKEKARLSFVCKRAGDYMRGGMSKGDAMKKAAGDYSSWAKQTPLFS